MVKILLELPNFLFSTVPLLTSTAIFAMLALVLARSIKKHPTAYYIAFALPFALVAVPAILRWCGVALPVNLTGVPVLGQILRDYIHMGTLGHPLLIVIMYMGALDTRREWVKRLISVRKELSIISGFPVLTHTLIRVASIPSSMKFFVDQQGWLSETPVASVLGAGFTNFSFLLGVILFVIFIPLWVTSFDSVHRRMGTVRWKKLQRWAYVFYAVMFIHAIGIQVGDMLNPRGGGGGGLSRPATEQSIQASARDDGTARPPVEQTADPRGERQGGKHPDAQAANAEQRGGQNTPAMDSGRRDGQNASAEQSAPRPAARRQAKGFSDFTVDSSAKRWIHLAELLLIYGSYLCLRLRKALSGKKITTKT